MKGIFYFNAILLALSAKVMAARAYCPPSGQHFFPHPQRCSQFIACNNGEYRIVDCIDGLHFNSAFGWCDYPENVECIQADDKTGPSKDFEYEQDKNYDSAYEEENDEDDGICPPSGQYFLPYPYDCSLFIECNNGQYSIVDCIYGLHFNRKLGWCDFPESAACIAARRTTEAPNDELSNEDASNDEALNDEVPNDEGGPNGSCPPINNPFTVYFLAHTRDCSIFYKCDWGTPIEMSCPAGLHFNRALNVCDWPWNAGCTAGK